MRTSENANENNREIPDSGLRRKIEARAYHIWLENGGGHGDHERHWLQAERELTETTKLERSRNPVLVRGTKPPSRIKGSVQTTHNQKI